MKKTLRILIVTLVLAGTFSIAGASSQITTPTLDGGGPIPMCPTRDCK